jgi:hypothetical protein
VRFDPAASGVVIVTSDAAAVSEDELATAVAQAGIEAEPV